LFDQVIYSSITRKSLRFIQRIPLLFTGIDGESPLRGL
jgi:hypothetical protein